MWGWPEILTAGLMPALPAFLSLGERLQELTMGAERGVDLEKSSQEW